MKALGFARAAIKEMVMSVLPDGKLKKLSDAEIVNGYHLDDEVMKKVNLEASAGVPLGGVVADWIDIEKSIIHPKVIELMAGVESLARQGRKDYNSVKFKDCNKDEMRDYEKRQKPRCFAAGPLHYTLLLRRWFGRLTTLFMKHRLRTGVMIGINATSKEWSTLWRQLCMRTHHFDGDYEMWDGAMRREFQEVLNELLAGFSEDPVVGLGLLMHLCETTRVGMDMTYITTHSVPSGHGLTALYNSLINKMYVAYAWYILIGCHLELSEVALLDRFRQDIYAPVYGDDIVCAVSDRASIRFNAITYAMVMRDLGLGFTSASKKSHDKPFSALRDITFLKRSFFAHRLINDITGPLALDVLRGSAGFVHDVTRDSEITTQKMSSLQRELFLHSSETYKIYWAALCDCYRQAFGVDYHGLTEVEMLELYNHGELRDDLFEAESKVVLPTRRSTRLLCRW
jgi:hypothetical protein